MTPNALAKIQQDMRAARRAMVNIFSTRAHRHYEMAEMLRDMGARALLLGDHAKADEHEAQAKAHEDMAAKCVLSMLREVSE
jgi:hypothetical protein